MTYRIISVTQFHSYHDIKSSLDGKKRRQASDNEWARLRSNFWTI